MAISKRLNLIINEIKEKNIIDIGTDHAIVPIVSLQKGIIKKAIASDIKIGPLKIAEKNIFDNGLESQIKIILSDGFENQAFNNIFAHEEKICGIISGMGGLVICEIINALKTKLFNMSQLVLQPQNNIYYVRKKLHEIGFMIHNEIFFCERKKFYNIITAFRGQDVFYSERDYALGKILLAEKNVCLYKYLLKEIIKLARIKGFNLEAQKFFDLYLEGLKCFVAR